MLNIRDIGGSLVGWFNGVDGVVKGRSGENYFIVVVKSPTEIVNGLRRDQF